MSEIYVVFPQNVESDPEGGRREVAGAETGRQLCVNRILIDEENHKATDRQTDRQTERATP